MNLDKLINSLTPDMYTSLKTAVELGKWDNGMRLTAEQLQNSMQLIIAYDARFKSEADRVGYVAPKVQDQCDSESDEQQWQTIKFKD